MIDPPLAHVRGRVRFMDLEVLVAPGALVPREETELLGYTALRVLEETAEPRIIDMCCGSGNLACGMAAKRPDARVWASDLTDGAVAVARANVSHLGLGERVTITQGDLFTPFHDFALQETIDVVVCNPPYISTGKLAKERAELLDHEPREAFDGGPYGVSIFQRVIRDSTAFLKPGGHLLFEIGVGQERQVTALFARANAYQDIHLVADYAGTPRVIVGRKGQ